MAAVGRCAVAAVSDCQGGTRPRDRLPSWHRIWGHSPKVRRHERASRLDEELWGRGLRTHATLRPWNTVLFAHYEGGGVLQFLSACGDFERRVRRRGYASFLEHPKLHLVLIPCLRRFRPRRGRVWRRNNECRVIGRRQFGERFREGLGERLPASRAARTVFR